MKHGKVQKDTRVCVRMRRLCQRPSKEGAGHATGFGDAASVPESCVTAAAAENILLRRCDGPCSPIVRSLRGRVIDHERGRHLRRCDGLVRTAPPHRTRVRNVLTEEGCGCIIVRLI